jgi:hypothetical protein
MKEWNDRPFEVRNLFNPAFSGLLLLRSIRAYQAAKGTGMPFSLSLLILPLCLHKNSREIIINSPRKYFLKTINANPQILIGFSERTRSLIPFSFEGLGIAMQHGSFEVDAVGNLELKKKGVRVKVDGSEESVECQKAAQILGKQFANIGDRVTIYTALGIRP